MVSGAAIAAVSIAMTSVDRFFDLRFHRFKIEARALLHGWEIDRRLTEFRHLLLHEHSTPDAILFARSGR